MPLTRFPPSREGAILGRPPPLGNALTQDSLVMDTARDRRVGPDLHGLGRGRSPPWKTRSGTIASGSRSWMTSIPGTSSPAEHPRGAFTDLGPARSQERADGGI